MKKVVIYYKKYYEEPVFRYIDFETFAGYEGECLLEFDTEGQLLELCTHRSSVADKARELLYKIKIFKIKEALNQTINGVKDVK